MEDLRGINMMNALKWLTHTKLGWFILSFIWTAIFIAIDSNVNGDWAFYIAIPGMAYMAGLTLLMIAYAWVINPIREYKSNKKLRKELEEKNKSK